MRSSIWPLVGRRTTSGSTSPVGRITCSTTCADSSSSNGPGVAETKIVWGVRDTNSSKRSGRLSTAEGSRNPCSTSTSLRERSPSYCPWSWGTATWLSSMTVSVVLREEVEERVGGLPRRAAVEVAAVVLDARADARLGQHLEVVLGADPQPLGLEQLALGLRARPAAPAARPRSSAMARWMVSSPAT